MFCLKKMHLPQGRCILEYRYTGMVLEETCPVVLHVGVIHHDGHEHLGVVLVLLLLVAVGIVLGVERTCVVALDLDRKSVV